MITLTEKTIIKSRSGIYEDTPENRRKHRVGQKYGDEKQPEDSEKTEKKEIDPKKELEAVNKVIAAINEGKLNLPAAEVVKLSEKKQKLEAKLKRDKKPDKNEEPKKESETKSQPQKERVSLSGWESNSLSDVKKYGEEGVVSSMSVQAVPNLKEMKYEYSASVSASRIAFDESEEFGIESEKLREKKFNSPNEAAKAAEEFALKWNSEKQKGSDVNLSRKGKEEKPKDDKSDPKQGEAEESYTRVKFDDIPNSGKVNLKKYLSEKMKKSADEAWGDITKIDTKDLQKMEKGLVDDFNRQFDDLPKSRRAEKLYAIMKAKSELERRKIEDTKEPIENNSLWKKDLTNKKELKKEQLQKTQEFKTSLIQGLEEMKFSDLVPKYNMWGDLMYHGHSNLLTFHFRSDKDFEEQKRELIEQIKEDRSVYFDIKNAGKTKAILDNFDFQKAKKNMNFTSLKEVEVFQTVNSKIDNSDYSEKEIEDMKLFFKSGYEEFLKEETAEGKSKSRINYVNSVVENSISQYQSDHLARRALSTQSYGSSKELKNQDIVANHMLMSSGYLPVISGDMFPTYQGESYENFRFKGVASNHSDYLKMSERAFSKFSNGDIKKAVVSYSEGRAYEKIRGFLSGTLDKLSPQAQKVMDTLGKFLNESSLEKNMVLYRRLSIDEKSVEGLNRLNDFYKMEIGDTFEDKSFGSFSMEPLTTFGKDFQITLLAKAGSKVAPIGNTLNNFENEFLTQKGMKFKVVAKGTNSIAVEIIDNERS